MYGTCPICRKCKKLTKDHIIPKWLYSNMNIFDVKKNLGSKNIQYICSPCNNEKGGKPDFNHPVARELGIKIIEYITKQLNKK